MSAQPGPGSVRGRILPAINVFNYSQSNGWTDYTSGGLGRRLMQMSLAEAVEAEGFITTPAMQMVYGPVHIIVYDNPKTREHLVVVVTPTMTHFIIASGLPSLLDVLRFLRPIAEAVKDAIDLSRGPAGGNGGPAVNPDEPRVRFTIIPARQKR